MSDDLIAKGKAIVESDRYLHPRGRLLGRIEAWGLDAYEGSPKEWKAALLAEAEEQADGAE